MPRLYKVLTAGAGVVESDLPARFAAITTTKVFGRLTCSAGKRAKPQNRVFLGSWEDAIALGFRPCRVCRPKPDDRYVRDDRGWQLVGESDSKLTRDV